MKDSPAGILYAAGEGPLLRLEVMMVQQKNKGRTRLWGIAGILCGAIAISQAAPAPTTVRGGASVTAASGGDPAAVLSPKASALLRATAAKLSKDTRGTTPARAMRVPKAGAPLASAGKAHSTPMGGKQSGADASAHLMDAPPDVIQRGLQRLDRCAGLSKDGDEFAKEGNWNAAVESYVGALGISPTYPEALYGAAACAGAIGDVRDEILYYRHAIYSLSPAFGDRQGFREEDPTRLMTFALLLQQTGQTDEALLVYNHAIVHLNIDPVDGSAMIPIPLPILGPGGLAYTPQRLEAMAQLGLIVKSSASEESRASLKEALRLWPDSVAANYYLGVNYDETNDNTTARAYLERARQLGNASDRAEVDRMLKFIPPFK